MFFCLVAWTDPWHHFYWRRHEIIRIEPFDYAHAINGPGYFVHAAYCTLLVVFAILLLARASVRSSGMFRAQAGLMLFGVSFPWVASILQISNVFGAVYVDLAVMTFGVTALAFLPDVLRYKLLDLTPVAWAAVVEGMSDPVVVFDPAGRLVELNPAARELADQPYPAVTRNRGLAGIRVLARSGQADRPIKQLGEASFAIEGRDAAYASWFDARISRLGDGEHPAGWVLVLRDITERRRAEEERARTVREQAARAEAEASNRAKDRFLATLSHELRTPLTPILAGVTALLDDPSTPSSIRAFLEMTRRNTVLEARLIDDLLDISRIEHGKLHLRHERVNAHELISNVLTICRGEIAAAGLELGEEIAAGRFTIYADPIRIQQVLWNLVKNAIKFTPNGGLVRVLSRNVDTPSVGEKSTNLIIEIHDTGIGIAEQNLDLIFDIFEQGGVSGTRNYGGLGLGLTLSRWIAEEHGGKLSVASDGPNQGATFSLDLPTITSVDATDNGARADESLPMVQRQRPAPILTSPGTMSAGHPLKILLVEDNNDTLHYLCEILSRRGHIVRAADSLLSARLVAAEFEMRPARDRYRTSRRQRS